MARRPNQVSMPNPEFGVDFDASARAMHQSASKGSLMVHETAFSTPAVVRKSLAATMFERNTMLKTLKRKIALVAVAALGAGGLTIAIAPAANAAAGDATAVNVNTSAAVANFISVTTNAGSLATAKARAGDCLSLTVTIVDPAAAGSVKVVDASGTDITSTTCTDTDTQATGVNAADNDNATAATDTTEDISFVAPSTIGSQTITVQSFVGAAAKATKSFTLTTVGAPVSVSVTGRTYIETDGTAPSDGAESTIVIKLKDSYGNDTILDESERIVFYSSVVSEPGGVTTTQAASRPSLIEATTVNGAGVTYDEGSLDADEYDHQTNLTNGVSTLFEDTSIGGKYTITYRLMNGALVIQDKTVPVSVLDNTTGLTGTIAWTDASAVALTSVSAAQGDNAVDLGYVTVTLADGSWLVGGTVTFTASATGAAGLTVVNGTATTALASGNTSATDTDVNVGATATGTLTVTAAVATGAASSISASLPINVVTSVFVANYDVDVEATGTTSTFKELTDVPTTGVTVATATATYNLNPSQENMTLDIVVKDAAAAAVSGASIGVTIADNGASVADDTQLTVASATITTDAAGKATVVAKNVTPSSTESYIVTFKSGSNTLGTITVTYASPTATTTTFAATSITAKVGTEVTAEFTVTDQYGAGWASKDVAWTRSGVNTATSGTAQTDATGKVVYKWTDAVKAAGSSDVFSVTAPAASLTVTYSAADPTVASFAWAYDLAQGGTYTSFTTQDAYLTAIATANNNANAAAGATFEDAKFLPIDTAGNYADTATASGAATAAQDELVQLRITAKDAAGTALAGVKVTVTASTGAKIIDTTPKDSIEKYTNASGQLAFTVFSTKVGDAKWTVKVGSVESTFTSPYANDLEDARILSMKTAPTTAAAGNVVQFVALVSDRYGNAVKGDSVVFTESGAGRLEGTTTVTTDAAGEALIDFSTLTTESGTGKVTATVAGSQVANTAGAFATDGTAGTATDYSTDAAAGVATLTANITITAAAAVANPALDAVKGDVKAVSDTVATLSKAVTTIQSSVTELTSSFSAQIKSLSSAIAKISRAIAALSKRIK